MEALLCSLGLIDFIYHKKLTPWDHSPLDILCRSSGCKVSLAPENKSFNLISKGNLLVTNQINNWKKIYNYIL